MTWLTDKTFRLVVVRVAFPKGKRSYKSKIRLRRLLKPLTNLGCLRRLHYL